MPIAHTFAADLAVGPTGDLAVSSGTKYGVERVLRRLLTNPGDLIWHPTYGAGLLSLIGQPINEARIRALIRSQILKEKAVARQPAPTITVTSNTTGMVAATIRYTDATTGETQTLTVPAA